MAQNGEIRHKVGTGEALHHSAKGFDVVQKLAEAVKRGRGAPAMLRAYLKVVSGHIILSIMRAFMVPLVFTTGTHLLLRGRQNRSEFQQQFGRHPNTEYSLRPSSPFRCTFTL